MKFSCPSAGRVSHVAPSQAHASSVPGENGGAVGMRGARGVSSQNQVGQQHKPMKMQLEKRWIGA